MAVAMAMEEVEERLRQEVQSMGEMEEEEETVLIKVVLAEEKTKEGTEW